jgi:hypothetical protein
MIQLTRSAIVVFGSLPDFPTLLGEHGPLAGDSGTALREGPNHAS